MESVSVERLNHLGVIASVIKDLGIVEIVEARLGLHDQEEITAGEAVSGMIDHPLSGPAGLDQHPPRGRASARVDMKGGIRDPG